MLGGEGYKLSNVIKHTRENKYKKAPLIFYFPVCRVDMEDDDDPTPHSRVHKIREFSNVINLGHHVNEEGRMGKKNKGLKWSSKTVSWEGNNHLKNV